MFNPRKTTDQTNYNPGYFGIIIAVMIALSLTSQLFSSGLAPKVFLGFAVLFALWWLYTKFVRKQAVDQEKYQKALREQKKKKFKGAEKTEERGKVIYLKDIKR